MVFLGGGTEKEFLKTFSCDLGGRLLGRMKGSRGPDQDGASGEKKEERATVSRGLTS